MINSLNGKLGCIFFFFGKNAKASTNYNRKKLINCVAIYEIGGTSAW